MYIILAIVTSLDGKTTNSSDQSPSYWASKEDQELFFSLIKENNLIVMGKNTYLVRKPHLKLSKNKLRIVLTRNPEKFTKDQIPGQVEFTNEPLKNLVQKLEDRGYNQMLLVSGASLNTAFFKEKLINELWLTIEPKIFGTGLGIVDYEKLDINFKLKSIKKLNSNGTLLLKYLIK